MTSPCQNCPERRLVRHDYCPAYLEYHERGVRIKEQMRKERSVTTYIIAQTTRIERRVRAKRSR